MDLNVSVNNIIYQIKEVILLQYKQQEINWCEVFFHHIYSFSFLSSDWKLHLLAIDSV